MTERTTLQGVFITLDGIDGCGKSTQARQLVARLRELGHAVRETREPGGTPVGEALRAILLDEAQTALTPSCELLLFLADRVQHLAEVIRPALARGETVICDRYHDATVAYQKYGRKLDFSAVEEFITAEISPTPPDITFWLDVDVDTARTRIGEGGPGASGREAQRPGGERRLDMAAREFFQRVRGGYLALAEQHPGRILRIDGGRDSAAVAEEIWQHLQERYDDL